MKEGGSEMEEEEAGERSMRRDKGRSRKRQVRWRGKRQARIAELRKLEDKIHHLEKEIEQYKERLVDKEEIIKLLKKESATNTY